MFEKKNCRRYLLILFTTLIIFMLLPTNAMAENATDVVQDTDIKEEEQLLSTTYPHREEIKTFWGFGDIGVVGWKVYTNYSLTVNQFDSYKSVSRHRISSHMKTNYRFTYGNGNLNHLSSRVFRNTQQIAVHWGSSFSDFAIMFPSHYHYYLHHQKYTSDTMDGHYNGQARAGLQFTHNNFFPTNDWNKYVNINF